MKLLVLLPYCSMNYKGERGSMLFLVSRKYLHIIIFKKLSSCMNAKSFAKSGAGAVPMNMPDDCLYTAPQNCTNLSSNTKLIHSHSLVLPNIYIYIYCCWSFH